MRRAVADIETDGLLDTLTKVHCLSVRCVDTGRLVSCADQPGYTPIAEGLALLEQCGVIYFHNGVRFDVPALRKVYPEWNPRGRILDTFVAASFIFAHAKELDYAQLRTKGGYKLPGRLIGSHSLEAWGRRLGVHKGDYTDWCRLNGVDPWAEWRPEMQTYCEQDTEVTRLLVLALRKEGVPAEALDTEHALAAYLAQQEANGCPFDTAKAASLAGTLSARREELRLALVAKFAEWREPDGKPFTPKRDNASLGYKAGVPVQKWKTVQFNPKSRHHIERCLREHYGWEPSSFTKTGQAEITEETLEALSHIPEASLLVEYLTIQKRLGMLSEGRQAWLKQTVRNPHTGLDHIHGRVKQNHAITHRAAHASPNLAQVPKVGSPYGAECRELFHVPEGWVQIGADASGLELRCLAHYMGRYDGGAYGDVVLNGDIHTVNMQAAGLATRNEAKTFIYAYLYGEGDEARGAKFLPAGATPEQKKKKGRQVATKFTKGLPALGSLQAAVKACVKRGWVQMPDGRKTYIRHEHAALNSLLQSSGAIICKRWIVEFNRRLTARFGPQGWGGKWAALLWIHDEVQLAVRPEIADEVRAILVDSIRFITQHYKWRIPLDGEAKVGANWRECH